MRLYEGTVSKFNDDVLQNRIADLVKANYEAHYQRRVNESEYRSWQASLTILNNSFLHSKLTDNQIVVEYELPYSTRRIDVLIFGVGEDKKENVVLIELKQWSNDHVHDCETEGNIIVDYGRFKNEVAHPSLQVEGYHFDLQDFMKVFQGNDALSLSSCVYCHNYSKGKGVLFAPKFQKAITDFPLFSKEDVTQLGDYLKKRLNQGAGLEIFNRFINSPIGASKKLLEHTSQMINEQQTFTLIDDQIAAYNAIMHRAKQLSTNGKKSVVIVKGGPGTGKSVIALEVMGELMRQGKIVFHATGSSAFTKTLRKIVDSVVLGYLDLQNDYLTEKWKLVGLDAGHFVEAVRRLLELELFGAYTPLTKRISDFNDSILRDYQEAKGDISYRILIPVVLKSIYNIRNHRGVGHLAAIKANRLDASYVIPGSRWIMAEIIRLKSSMAPAATQQLVDSIVERMIPVIWSGDGILRVLDPSMKANNQVLLFLSQSAGGVLSIDTLYDAVEYGRRYDFIAKVIKPMHRARLIELLPNNDCKISPHGERAAEKILARYSAVV